MRQAPFRGHEFYPAFVTELGNLTINAHQALDQVRKNCWEYDWVIDLDIKNFFHDIDHGKLLKALGKHVEEKWVLRYIERWLKAPLQTRKGGIIARTNGTPQGGVISPLLANLFLHYTLDVWLGRLNPSIEFVRYADDIIIHCRTQVQARQSLQKIKERVEDCGLTLHPEKTKIVYCKDFKRQQKYEKVQFDFLGYTFQPRTSKSKKTGRLFLGFDCAISIQSISRIFEQIRKMENPRMRCDSIVGIAYQLNPKLRGYVTLENTGAIVCPKCFIYCV